MDSPHIAVAILGTGHGAKRRREAPVRSAAAPWLIRRLGWITGARSRT